jgi:hypothetical protein
MLPNRFGLVVFSRALKPGLQQKKEISILIAGRVGIRTRTIDWQSENKYLQMP